MEKISKQLEIERKKNPLYVKGAFKLFTYIEISDQKISSEFKRISEGVKHHYSRAKGVDMEVVEGLHISLTKNYHMDFKKIKPFVSEIRNLELEFSPLNLFIDTKSPVFYKSETGVRYTAFKIIRGNEGSKELERMRRRVMGVIDDFGLELVSKVPVGDVPKPKDCISSKERMLEAEAELKTANGFEFHVSLLKTTSKINRKIIKKIILDMHHNSSLVILTVNNITLRIGDKSYSIKLNSNS